MKKIIIYILIPLCMSIYFYAQYTGENIKNFNLFPNGQLSLGISFPEVSTHEGRKFSEKSLRELNIGAIRFAEEWKHREPIKGEFYWDGLDQKLLWAKENNLKVMLTIQSNGPSWACKEESINEKSCVFNNPADYKHYLSSLLARHKDNIDILQFGNEWQSLWWYNGDIEEYITYQNLTHEVSQSLAPKINIALGGISTTALRAQAICNGSLKSAHDDEGIYYTKENCRESKIERSVSRIEKVLTESNYDFIDIHLYDDVKNWGTYKSNIESLSNKPIIVSEFGGPNTFTEIQSGAYQAFKLYLYLKRLENLGITRAYYFKLLEGSQNKAHSTSGLYEKISGNKKNTFPILQHFSQKSY